MPEATDPAMAEMREAYGCSEYELWFQGHDRKIVKIGLTVDQVIEAVRHGIDVRPCGGVHLDSATLQAFEKPGCARYDFAAAAKQVLSEFGDSVFIALQALADENKRLRARIVELEQRP